MSVCEKCVINEYEDRDRFMKGQYRLPPIPKKMKLKISY
jgi:hypothetical protein